MNTHTKEISRLLNIEMDVDEHILNLSSYNLSFFQKLVLCRRLKFAIPRHVSAIDVKASFEKAYWSLELHLNNNNLKELSAATLCSVALNCIERKSPKPPKMLLRAIDELKDATTSLPRNLTKGLVLWSLTKPNTYDYYLRPQSMAQASSVPFPWRDPRPGADHPNITIPTTKGEDSRFHSS